MNATKDFRVRNEVGMGNKHYQIMYPLQLTISYSIIYSNWPSSDRKQKRATNAQFCK
jgi:hypothetical protein